MATPSEPHVIAANNDKQVLSSTPHIFTLNFAPSTRHQPLGKLPADPSSDDTAPPYTAVFLNFENIVGKGQPPVYEVYVNLPDDAEPNADHRAGALPLYGLAASSTPHWEHDGSGQRVVLDITELFNRLRTQPEWSSSQLRICLQPRKPLTGNASVSIGRVSLYIATRP